MNSQTLREARKYEDIYEKLIKEEDRPAFHLTPRVGWMNDPNGFCYHEGKYHMFYQYHPYTAEWGPMHWGHAVSDDLLHWEFLPAALAPDEYYDKDGCFSGSAITLEDGRHLLIYTGVMNREVENGLRRDFQVQCVAIGDGIDYVKYDQNPVMTSDLIPEGSSPYDFRDPKICRKSDGTYRCYVGNRPEDGSGQILLFKSEDALHWEFEKVFASNRNRYGKMWECPDFFALDGKGVLLVSPQDMLPEGFEYHNGNGTVCVIGDYDDASDTFTEECNQAIDYGIDFYAPQTVLSPDGRRIMIGWMQNWDTTGFHDIHEPWYGQMSIPRELSVRDGRLYQKPIRELDGLRTHKTEYKNVALGEESGTAANPLTLYGISGRRIDMELKLRPLDHDKIYHRFIVSVAQNADCHTDIGFRPQESIVKIDRKFSGSRRAIIHQRRAKVASTDGCLNMRIIMDRFSVEIFLEDGREVMTAKIFTEQEAEGISFWSDGKVLMDVVKYDLIG